MRSSPGMPAPPDPGCIGTHLAHREKSISRPRVTRFASPPAKLRVCHGSQKELSYGVHRAEPGIASAVRPASPGQLLQRAHRTEEWEDCWRVRGQRLYAASGRLKAGGDNA